MPIIPIFLATVLALGFGWWALAPHHFDHEEIYIEGQEFDAEIAATPYEQQVGLSGRSSVPADTAMVFPIPYTNVSMWMKGTSVSLDMLFVKDGHVSKIVTHTEPESLTLINSDGPVQEVIEIAAGEADKDGFKVGDLVSY